MYTITPDEEVDLNNWFTYHPPQGDQGKRYELLREAGMLLAKTIMQCCPKSADRTTALRSVRETVMRANLSIACGECVPQP